MEETNNTQEETDSTPETNEEDNQTLDDQSTEQQDAVDYKAAYEAEVLKSQKKDKELNQARFKLAQENKAKKESQAALNKDNSNEESENDAALDTESIVEEAVNRVRKEMSASIVESSLDTLTSNEDEKKLIKLFYENKIVKSGYDKESVAEDLAYAQLLANKQKIEKLTSEFKAKSKSDSAKETGGTSSGQTIESDSTGKNYTAAEKALLQKYGAS